MVKLDNEEWRPVVGWEEAYEVSSLGRVRSLDREINHGRGLTRLHKGRIRSLYVATTGYLSVGLSKGGVTTTVNLHRIMAESFIPNPSGLAYVRHLNDEKLDNRIENLRWGTPSDNSYDAVRNGVHRNGNSGKESCIRGHELTSENVTVSKKGFRSCKICQAAHAKSNREKYMCQGLPDPNDSRHGSPAGYSMYGCRCDKCKSTKSKSDKIRRSHE